MYRIGMFKRHKDTILGGFWVQPGGLVDTQDYPDVIFKNINMHLTCKS